MSRSPQKKDWWALCAIVIALHMSFPQTVLASSVVDQAEQSVVRVLNLTQRANRLQINGVGSGVVVDRGGFILTNEHVIAGAKKIYVQRKTASGEVRDDEAEVVARDRDKDLALLRVRGIETPMVPIATSTLVKGQLVYAIGFPAAADLFGTVEDINQSFVEATVTQGIVSRLLTRDLPSNPKWPLVQHSAATSAGSSGGALIDGCGYLVGISAATAVDETGRGDVVRVAGFSYAIQALEVFRFAKSNGANPAQVEADCKVDTGSAQVVTDGKDKKYPETRSILIFVLGVVAAIGAVVAVVYQGRQRQSRVTPPPPALAGKHWRLEGWTGSNERVLITVIEGRHTESRPLLIGRDVSSGAIVADPTVSRTHAKLYIAGGDLWCADLGSSNGTKVNDKPCGERPVRVSRAGVLTLGNVRLTAVTSPERVMQ